MYMHAHIQIIFHAYTYMHKIIRGISYYIHRYQVWWCKTLTYIHTCTMT
jgi:hypothetical protein